MKTIPITLQATYDSGDMHLAAGLFIVRGDGQAFGFTSHDQAATLDLSAWWDESEALAFELDPVQGLNVSNLVTTSGLEVGNLEATVLATEDDGSFFDRDEIMAGLWKEAQFWVFKYDYTTAEDTDDFEVLMFGTLGEFGLNLNTIVVELRDITQKLQQPVGIKTQPNCRARLGDDRCTVDLASYTFVLTVTAVSDSKQVFTCAAAVQATDYFGEGIVSFQSGNLAGISFKVAEFDSGEFTLVVPTWLDIQVGDTLSAVAGCRKRHQMTLDASGDSWTLVVSDCKDKFNNVLNFQGEPHVPPVDQLTASPNPNA